MKYNKTITSLMDAVKFSEDNIALRAILANTFYDEGYYFESEIEYIKIIKIQKTEEALFGLAKSYMKQEKFKNAIVLLEDLITDSQFHLEYYELLVSSLLKNNELGEAGERYETILQNIPEYKNEHFEDELKLLIKNSSIDFNDSNLDSEIFLSKPKEDFSNVGGLDEIKKEISLKIIKPLTHSDLYKSYGKKVGGGILLYGPPGCGKTYLARATAGEINAKFIHIGLDKILDMWVGNSEKNLNQIFESARQNRPCVLFFDEIDSLSYNRSDFTFNNNYLINQFLNELDGIKKDNDGILFLGATNSPWNIDNAFKRPGRFDRIIFVPPPDLEARIEILKIKLDSKPIKLDIDFELLAEKSEHFSGADIECIIDIAIEKKLSESIDTQVLQPIGQEDLMLVIENYKPTIIEWFSKARNYVLYSNASGFYDDVRDYLRL